MRGAGEGVQRFKTGVVAFFLGLLDRFFRSAERIAIGDEACRLGIRFCQLLGDRMVRSNGEWCKWLVVRCGL